jgi:anti-sigma B factor antagonist
VAAEFHISMRQGDRRELILTISGDLDVVSAPQLRQGFLDIVSERGMPDLVVLDCEGVTFIDSTGMGLFIGLHRRLTEAGADLLIVNLNERVGKPLRLTGLDQALKIEWTGGD